MASRGQLMVAACSKKVVHPLYCTVKIIERDTFLIVKREELKPNDDGDLFILKYDKKDYHVIVINTGGKEENEKFLKGIKNYEKINKKYKNLSVISKYVQTDDNLEFAGSKTCVESKEMSTQTEPSYSEKCLVVATEETFIPVPSELNRHFLAISDDTPVDIAELDSTYLGYGLINQGDSQLIEETSASNDEGIPEQQIFLPPEETLQQLIGEDQENEEGDLQLIEETSASNDEGIPEQQVYLPPEESLQHSVHQDQANEEDFLQLIEETSASNDEGIPEQHILLPPQEFLQHSIDEDQANEEGAENSLTTSSETPTLKYRKKKHFCKYCQKLIGNFSRHIKKKHSQEEEVVTLSTLTTRPDKLKLMKKIMNEGDVIFNEINEDTEKFIPVRKTNNPVKCANCKLFVSKNHILAHLRKCKPNLSTMTGAAIRVQINRQNIQNNEELSEDMKNKVIPFMRNDNMKTLCLTDQSLISFGNALCKRFKGERQEKTIRNHLRILARVSSKTIEISGGTITSVLDIFKNKNYNIFLKAIEDICGFGQAEREEMLKPTTPHQYGLKMRELSGHLMTNLLIQLDLDDNEACTNEDQLKIRKSKENIEAWQKIYDQHFDRQIASLGRKQAERRNYETKQILPTTQDIQQLLVFIEKSLLTAYEQLKEQFRYSDFITLTKCLLCKLWIFNRRRVGDVDIMTLESWLNGKDVDENSEQYKTLNPTEKQFASSFKRIKITQKGRRPQALLVAKKDLDKFSLMINLRTQANITEENEFLFADHDKHVEGTKALHAFAKESGVVNYKLLTGTRLRKHLAASLRYINLTDEDLRLVAEAMGHTEKTHLTKYRVHDPALHAGRMGRILIAMDEGNISKYAGKTLNEFDNSVALDYDQPAPTDEPEEPEEPALDLDTFEAPSTSRSELEEHACFDPTVMQQELEVTPKKSKKRKNSDDMDYEPEDDEEETKEETKPVRGNTPGRRRTFAKRKSHTKARLTEELKNALKKEMEEELKKKKCPTTARVLEVMGSLSPIYPQISNLSPKKVKTLITNWYRKM